jgi:AraC-like DNA-binding protein
MPAAPLTGANWSGLPLLMCDMDPGLYRIDVGTPMLVVRQDLGTRVEVLSGDGRGLRFRQAPLRFDLFAAGLQMNALSDRPATKSLVVALPEPWLGGDVLRPRFQFADLELRRLIWRLTTHHRSGEPLGADYSGAVSRVIVDRVMELQIAAENARPGRQGLDRKARQTVDRLLEGNLQEPPTVAAMASAVGLGITRFLQQFKASFEATPHQVLQQRRLARARELLLQTDASLTTIALETGFSSHAHFSTVFRATLGVTPSHFRRGAQGGPHLRGARAYGSR